MNHKRERSWRQLEAAQASGAARARNLAAQRFGRLVVVALDQRINRKAYWLCRCDCGAERSVYQSHLLGGRSTSCGCVRREKSRARRLTHGESMRTAEYGAWANMKSRCLNRNHPDYDHYGGRGITVCAAWRSFEQFRADMGARPAGLTLDRIDVNGNYEPGNCRWATWAQQANNKRGRSIA